VAVQKARWDSGGSEPAYDYTFLYGNRNADHQLGMNFFVREGITSAIQMVAFITDRVSYTRAVCKVRGLTLLLRVGTLWRCGDGLFFEIPPLAIDALLTTLRPLFENALQTVDHFEISCLGAPF
jgi:hypothetical protein